MNSKPLTPKQAKQLRQATAWRQAGRWPEAAALYRDLLHKAPRHPPLLSGLGEILVKQGRCAEGLELLEQSVLLDPKQPEALFSRCMALVLLNRLEEAEACFAGLLALAPHHALAHNNRGNVLVALGRHDQALDSYRLAIAALPDYAEAHYNLGVAQLGLRRYSEALSGFDAAIALRPDYAQAYNNRGLALQGLQQPEAALASFRQAISNRAHYAEAHYNLGTLFLELKQFEAALDCFDAALALRANYAKASCNRGIALKNLRRLEDALACYDQALALAPDAAELHCNRGTALRDLLRLDEAQASYLHAISLAPEYAEAYWNLALLYLLRGDYQTGWRMYEWRWRALPGQPPRHFAQDLWLGDAEVAGRTVLIYPEQGLGDFMQFCRYAPLLAAKGAKVIIETPPALLTLLGSLAGDFSLVAQGEALPDFDLRIPLLSLPLAFATTLEDIPAGAPYLFADAAKREAWRQRLGIKTRPRVGLVWSGTPEHLNDHNRSLPCKLFQPLLGLPLEFHSLQKNLRAEDAEALAGFKQIYCHSDALADFADTAALIAELDLVISVDTSVAHLAGALAKPVYVLLPFRPDFRWGLLRPHSAWYPTATLFRQSAIGDWSGVIAALVETLKTRFAV